jgi:hypothetical protein
MPLKRRKAKDRQIPITPWAVELFLAMRRLKRGSDAWCDRHAELHAELACRPWEYPLDRVNATHIWSALEKAAEASTARLN